MTTKVLEGRSAAQRTGEIRRLLDHLSQRTVDLSKVEILVLDEADRMLDMGFIRDIRKVLVLLPKQKQTLLFSATFSDEIKQLSKGLLNSPALVMQEMGFGNVISLKTGLRGWNEFEQPMIDKAGNPVDIDDADEYFTAKLRPEQLSSHR